MDISCHGIAKDYFEYYEEVELIEEIGYYYVEEEFVEEIDSSDDSSEHTLTSFAENELLSTIVEETSLDLWTKDSSMSKPSLGDLDSICTMDSTESDQDTLHSQEDECVGEIIVACLRQSHGRVETNDDDTELQKEVLTSPINDAGYSRRSEKSRATLSTASLSRSSSMSSFTSPSCSERIRSIPSLHDAQSDQVVNVLEQGTHSLVGVNIQFLVSTESGSATEELKQQDSPLLEPFAEEEAQDRNFSDKKEKRNKKGLQEKSNSKKSKKGDVNKDSKQSQNNQILWA